MMRPCGRRTGVGLFAVFWSGILLGLLSALLPVQMAEAATCTSVASGDWNQRATWGSAAVGCAGAPGGIPGTADTANIANLNHTVTVSDDRTVNVLSMTAGNRYPNLTVAAGVTFRVNNSMTVGGSNGGSGTRLVTVSAGATLDIGNDLIFSGGSNNNRDTELLLEDDAATTVTIGGDFGRTAAGANFNGTARNRITFNGRGTLRIGRNFGGNATLSPGTGTVEFNGTVNQTIGAYNATTSHYYNLTINKASGTATFAGNTRIRGNISDDGRLNALSGNRTITLDGASQQNLLGTATATTFYRVTLNNASGLSLAHDLNISNLLTLTTGAVTTGSNRVYIQNGSNISSAGGADFIIGKLAKFYGTGSVTRTFEVGSLTGGARYTPVSVRLGAVTTAGEFSVSTTAGDHPDIANSGVDAAKSVNRYWTLAADTVAFNGNNNNRVIFTFVAADVDAGAVTGSFVAGRYNGSTWNTITPTGRTATTTTVSGASLTQTTLPGAYQLGEAKPVVATPGDLNAFETATASTAVSGRIYTKLAGTAFTLDVVAILSGARHSAFNNTVAVDLVTGSTGGLNCPGAPVAIAGTAQNVTLAAGRATTGAFSVASAHRDVRVRIRYPVSSPTVTSCSNDNFAIRPVAFSVTSTDATQTGTSGTPVIKTGANFSLSATAVSGYDGTPAINNALVTGTPNAGTIGGVFNAASAATGVATGSSFYYSEVGHFGLSANAVYDAGFTSVDQSGDCVASGFSNVLAGGQYGCNIGSAAVAQTTGSSGFGRFIPDNFNVTVNTPAFASACTGFSYIGQSFNYNVAPVMTVTARNGSNNGLSNAATRNYAGAYVKLSNASLAQAPYDTQGGRYSRFDALSGTTPALSLSALPAVSADPVIGTFANGVATLTFSGGSGLSFARPAGTPSAEFDADIALELNVVDADGVSFAGNPAAFGEASDGNGILFSDGNASTTIDARMRFGRLDLGSASGSQTLPLLLPVQAQYWNGFAFIDNTLDSCTTLQAGDVGLGNYAQDLGAGDTTVSVTQSPLASGRSAIRLSAPGAADDGGVDVTINLGSAATANACPAFAPATVSGAGRGYLRGRWCGSAYDRDPVARARFGIRGGNPARIDMREQF